MSSLAHLLSEQEETLTQKMKTHRGKENFLEVYIFFIKTLFRFSFTDTQCGFKYINVNMGTVLLT